jgi:DNA invertase Pin-like site-specific DNA recombinase
MKTILYARVSTADQTLAHQLSQAQAAGFSIDQVVADEGISGVSTTLSERPQGRRLFDLLRKDDTLVVRWVDRLGRNYRDVCDTIREFMRRGILVRTVINGMTFDGATGDPMQQAVRDALIAFMAATAQAHDKGGPTSRHRLRESAQQAVQRKEAELLPGAISGSAGFSCTRREDQCHRGVDWSLSSNCLSDQARSSKLRGGLDSVGYVNFA